MAMPEAGYGSILSFIIKLIDYLIEKILQKIKDKLNSFFVFLKNPATILQNEENVFFPHFPRMCG